jgi:branched-chain amino acid transport system permease protein
VDFFFTQLFNGLTAGVVYAMLAVGYSLVYGILQQINFAHGYIYMFGAFTTMSMLTGGAPLYIAILGGIVSGVVIALLLERFAYRPVRGNRMAPTVTAVAAGLIIQNAAQLLWGPTVRPLPFPLQSTIVHIGSFAFSPLQGIILIVGLVMAGILWVVTSKTNVGRAMRAVRDDLPTAELMGIPVNVIVVSVYVLGAIFGVIGGILYGAYYGSISITMGFAGTLNAFTATVIGGIGSIWGPFLGGLLLGTIQSLVTGYVSSALLNTVTFVALIFFLLVRPNGLAGLRSVNRL